MCLWFACFGLHKHRDDWDAPPSMGAPLPPPTGAATKPPHPPPRSVYGGAQQFTYNVNGGAPHQTPAAAAAGHKVSNDVRKVPAAHAAAEASLKQPAVVVAGEVAGHGAAHHYHYYEREPVHREDAMDYHYSTANAATNDHERY